MRSGNTLVIVLAIALLLAAQLYIFFVFSSSGFKHTEKSTAHVRAIYVGESAFSRIIARLKGAPWNERWFRGAPFEERDVPLLGGRYSAYVADSSSDPSRKLVDVWMESRFDASVSVMYWQVLYVDDTLDFSAQVYPRFFTHLDSDDPTPFTGPVAPAISFVQNDIARQRRNRQRARDAARALEPVPDFAGVAGVLRIPAPGPAGLDALDPFGGPPIPGAVAVPAAQAGLPVPGATLTPPPPPASPPPPTPAPTPTPSPTPTATPTPSPTATLAGQFPDPDAPYPNGIMGATAGILATDLGFMPSDLPAIGAQHFDNATKAKDEWNKAINAHAQDFGTYAQALGVFLEEMLKLDTPQHRLVADKIVAYVNDALAGQGRARVPPLAITSYNPGDIQNFWKETVVPATRP